MNGNGGRGRTFFSNGGKDRSGEAHTLPVVVVEVILPERRLVRKSCGSLPDLCEGKRLVPPQSPRAHGRDCVAKVSVMSGLVRRPDGETHKRASDRGYNVQTKRASSIHARLG